MCEVREFTPIKGDLLYGVGMKCIDDAVAERYPETTKLGFMGVWNFFSDHKLVAQAWAKTSRSWWVVVKPKVSV